MRDDLSERFNRHKRKTSDTKDTNGSGDAYDTDDSDTTSETSDANNPNNANDTDDASETDDKTRNRKQVAMYLPEDLREELNDRYDRLDGQSKIDGDGGIEKHKDFYEGLVRCALDSDELEDYVLE